MAKRMRYKQIDQLLTRVLIADTAVFILYLVFASFGINALKIVTVIIALLGSALCLGYLYYIGEFKKARSMGFGAIIICTVVSLILNFPSPAPVYTTAVNGMINAVG